MVGIHISRSPGRHLTGTLFYIAYNMFACGEAYVPDFYVMSTSITGRNCPSFHVSQPSGNATVKSSPQLSSLSSQISSKARFLESGNYCDLLSLSYTLFFNSIVTSLSIWTTAMGERIWTRSTARKLQSIRHPNVMLRFSLPKFFRYAMSTHCNLRFFCIQNVAYRKSEGKRLSIFHTYCSS